MYIYIYIYIPVNPLPGVETNGSFFDLGMVPSCAAGCRLLVPRLHAGYRVTDCWLPGYWLPGYLVTYWFPGR